MPVEKQDTPFAVEPRGATLFKELADEWLNRQRKRVELGKLKPASLATFTSHTKFHILPHFSDLEVESIRNGKVKEFAEILAAKLGPKSVREVVAVVKQILESHVNEDGEPILDLRWRPAFIFENVKEIGQQKQPTISRDALNTIFSNRSIKVRDRVLLALAGSTGLRIGELLAIKINGSSEDSSWDSVASVIFVRKSIWRGQLQTPKTAVAVRCIDLGQPVNNMLLEFAKRRQEGEFLFATKVGKPISASHVGTYITKPNGIPGMHSLRRYRTTWCEEQGCPRALLAAWLGHSNANNITDRYVKSADDQAYRRQWVERVGTGLELVW